MCFMAEAAEHIDQKADGKILFNSQCSQISFKQKAIPSKVIAMLQRNCSTHVFD